MEEAFEVDQEASIEMPTGKVKDLSLPPKTQAEVYRSPFRGAFEYSQVVESDGLFDVRCFESVDLKDIPRWRKTVDSRWFHT